MKECILERDLIPGLQYKKVDKEHNLRARIDMPISYKEKPAIYQRGLEVGLASLKMKAEKELLKFADCKSIHPRNFSMDATTYDAYNEFTYEEILTEKVLDLEEKFKTKVGFQIFEHKIESSDILLVEYVKHEKYNIDYSVYFNVEDLVCQFVEIKT